MVHLLRSMFYLKIRNSGLLVKKDLKINNMKSIFTSLLLFAFFQSYSQANYDILIRNGKIIDGAGNSWYYADIAVKDGKIAAIGKLQTVTATKTIDAKGLIVAPG